MADDAEGRLLKFDGYAILSPLLHKAPAVATAGSQPMFRRNRVYRVGFPGWKLAARMGVPLKLRVEVMHDRESNSYWSTSPDLDGLIVTGQTLDELRGEVRIAAMDLLDIALHGQRINATPELRFRDEVMCAA